jgi:kumamolisin
MERAAIPGSAPDHAGYRREGAADPDAPVRATIVLRPADSAVAAELLSGRYDPAAHTATGAGAGAIAAVDGFARANGLTVEESDAAGRRVVVSGPSNRMGAAFGVSFSQFVSPDGARYLSHDGAVSLPSEISPYVLAVLGLDTRPVARPR